MNARIRQGAQIEFNKARKEYWQVWGDWCAG